MILTDSSAAKVGGSNVRAIASSTALYRQFMVYAATTISSVITGTIGIIKNGIGTLTLTGANTYSGATTINAGTLRFENGLATSRTYSISSGAVLDIAAGISLNSTSNTYNGNGTLILSSFMGRYASTAGTATFALGSSGIINLKAGAVLSSYYGGGYNFTGNLATFNLDGTIDGNSGVTLTAGALTGSGTATTSVALVVGVNNASTTFSGSIQSASTLTKFGTGTLTLSGNNTYTGTTTINNGTLALGSNQNLRTITGVGNIALGSYTLVNTVLATSNISGTISGTGAFTKMGAGTLTLSGNTTYTGATTISAGTLRVLRPFGLITPTAAFTATTLLVSFSGTLPSGVTNFRFFQGITTNTYASVTLVSVPAGTTATYSSANSTLSVIVP